MTIQKMMLLTALALSLYVQGSLAFAPSAAIGRWTNVPSVEASGLAALGFDDVDDSTRTVGRRDALSKMTSLLLMTTILGYSTPTYADVSDGNALPEGAAQFSRVVRAKSDMIAVSKRVSQGANEMDKTEWNNVGQFLRKVYAVGDDMKSIASGLDPEKKKAATVLIEDIKKYSKAADAPTGSQNGPEFLAYATKIITILDDFLNLLSDVPDEL